MGLFYNEIYFELMEIFLSHVQTQFNQCDFSQLEQSR